MSVDHVGLTVPDLEVAIDFFVEALGAEVVLRAGPYDDCGYVWPGESRPERMTVRLAVLSHSGTHNIELLEYANRERPSSTTPPEPADPGGAHLAFFVEDLEGVAGRLAARDDVRVLAPVDTERGGPLGGLEWSYFLTSWGLVVELVRWAPGVLPYERTTDARLVPPRWLAARGETERASSS